MAATLRFGVIGLGRAGSGMLSAMANHPDIKVTAAADLYEEHLNRFKEEFGGETFTDAAALCASPQVDAVYIATPHQFHVEHVIAAANRGKQIIVEKPMALTLDDCDRMIAAVDRAGVKMIVGHTASYNPGVMRIRELIRDDELGPLAMITSTAYTDFLYRPRRPEELVTDLGGGIIFNQVPHQVDATRFLAGGMVRSVRALTWVLDRDRPTEGAYMAQLEFETGIGASLLYSGYDHFSSRDLADASTSRPAESYGVTRRELGRRPPAEETAMRIATGYGGDQPRRRVRDGRGGQDGGSSEKQPRNPEVSGENTGEPNLRQEELGSFIVSCEQGDLRLTPDGVLAYTTQGLRRLGATPWRGTPGRGNVIDELYYAVTEDRPLVHHPRWAKATVEVCLAMLQSSREHRDITLQHQVPTVDWRS